jgi:ubiquinone/menaquinone biosynthesis C-methylase UbiE
VSSRSVYARPDVYDMEYEGASNHDAHFLARLLARIRPRRVLELACGSGRVTFTLASTLPTARIVGVDASIHMLGKAVTKRAGVDRLIRERVTFVRGDMRDWPGNGDAFDAVVIPCCSVSHLLTLDDRRRTWDTAFRLLRPGGVFILDVRVPDLATLAEAQRARPRAFVDLDIDTTRRTAGKKAGEQVGEKVGEEQFEEEGRLLRCTATTYEPHLQRADVRLLYDRFDERALAERLVTDFASHVYFPAELELLFLSAGFEIAQQYGDYRFTGVDRTSQFVVTMARRPRRVGDRVGDRLGHNVSHDRAYQSRSGHLANPRRRPRLRRPGESGGATGAHAVGDQPADEAAAR